MKDNKNLLVLFYSESCQPCQQQKPLVQEISKELKIPLELVCVDTPGAFEHAQKFGVKGWPHLFFVVDGTIKEETIGYDMGSPKETNKKRLLDTLNRVFKN